MADAKCRALLLALHDPNPPLEPAALAEGPSVPSPRSWQPQAEGTSRRGSEEALRGRAVSEAARCPERTAPGATVGTCAVAPARVTGFKMESLSGRVVLAYLKTNLSRHYWRFHESQINISEKCPTANITTTTNLKSDNCQSAAARTPLVSFSCRIHADQATAAIGASLSPPAGEEPPAAAGSAPQALGRSRARAGLGADHLAGTHTRACGRF